VLVILLSLRICSYLLRGIVLVSDYLFACINDLSAVIAVADFFDRTERLVSVDDIVAN
jgi:hypothetical protein